MLRFALTRRLGPSKRNLSRNDLTCAKNNFFPISFFDLRGSQGSKVLLTGRHSFWADVTFYFETALSLKSVPSIQFQAYSHEHIFILDGLA